MSYRIRAAVSADEERIRELYLEMMQAVYHTVDVKGYGDEDLERFWSESEDRIYVAEDDRVIAFISAEVHHDHGTYIYLNDLSVTESQRNRGIGTTLIRISESFAQEKGASAVLMHVEKTNELAMSLYERLGYSVYRDDGHRFLLIKHIDRGGTDMKALVVNCSPVKTGATAEITKIVQKALKDRYETKCICIDDYAFSFCTGCRSCHGTAECIFSDDVTMIMNEFDEADIIVCVSPSYWADVPGQFKAFIDRCTPWCNTHEPYARLRSGKKGYAIALRTGPGMKECERIIQTIEHFYGHLEIETAGHLGLTSIEYRENVEPRKQEIIDFCNKI